MKTTHKEKTIVTITDSEMKKIKIALDFYYIENLKILNNSIFVENRNLRENFLNELNKFCEIANIFCS